MTEVLSAMPPMLTFPPPPSSQSTQIREIPHFAFPIRPMEPGQTDTLPSSPRLELPQANKFHRRARTSVNTTPPLPSFSFGGSASATDTSSASTIPPSAQPTSPNQSLSPSTPPARHRRAVSEFGGGNAQPDALQQASSQPTRSIAPPQHRHRRSGAVDSQDLSHLRMARSFGTEPHQPTILTSGFEASGNTQSPSEASPAPSQGSPQSSARSVTFSDMVIKHNPRSASEASAESNSSQSTLRENAVTGTTSLPTFSIPGPSPPSPSLASEPDDGFDSSDPFVSSGLYQEPGTGVDVVELDENFDHDPTEAVAGTLEPVPYEVYGNDLSTESSASPSKDKSSPTVEPLGPTVDLDFASVDYQPAAATPAIRGVSFQRARASMHSAGSQSGSLASSLSSHRRTESAPSLSMSPFQPQSFDNAAEAGFEMTAVFEEDEEDDEEDEDTDKTPQATPVMDDTTKADLVSAERENTPTPLTGHHDVHTSPTLLPAFEYTLVKSTSHDDSEISRRSAESSVSRQQPSFVTLDDQSVSAKSSPGYAQGGISSHEPSVSTFQRSVDDVPSLISSGSTVGETTLANPSVRSLDPNVAVAGSTTSLAPVRPTHRKRHSVMSMSSMSMSVSRLFSTTSSQSGELDAQSTSRSNSTAGLEPPKPSKARRVMRMLGLSKKRLP